MTGEKNNHKGEKQSKTVKNSIQIAVRKLRENFCQKRSTTVKNSQKWSIRSKTVKNSQISQQLSKKVKYGKKKNKNKN